MAAEPANTMVPQPAAASADSATAARANSHPPTWTGVGQNVEVGLLNTFQGLGASAAQSTQSVSTGSSAASGQQVVFQPPRPIAGSVVPSAPTTATTGLDPSASPYVPPSYNTYSSPQSLEQTMQQMAQTICDKITEVVSPHTGAAGGSPGGGPPNLSLIHI